MKLGHHQTVSSFTNNTTEMEGQTSEVQNQQSHGSPKLSGSRSFQNGSTQSPGTPTGPDQNLRRADDFLPNPQIPSSPSAHSPKKIWEGAYKKFLLRGKSKSPTSKQPPMDSSTGDRSPSSFSSDNSKTLDSEKSERSKKNKSGFSRVPGATRLVMRSLPSTPKNDEGLKTSQSMLNTPKFPSITSKQGRIHSHGALDGQLHGNGHEGSESSVRGGSIFKSVFGRRSNHNDTFFRRMDSSSSDDLDAPLRNGIEKSSSSPEYRNSVLGQQGQTISEAENDSGGLNSILTHASTPTLYAGHRSHSSGHFRSTSWHQMHYPETSIENVDSTRIPVLLPPMKARQVAPITTETRPTGGSLLSQQMQQHQQTHYQRTFQEAQAQEAAELSKQQSSASVSIDSYLSDPNFIVDTSPSSIIFQQQPPIDPETKKAFTMYHNDSRYNHDSTEPFLGSGSGSDAPISLRNYSHLSHNLVMARGGGSFLGTSDHRPLPPTNKVSTSLPLEPVDQQNMVIYKGMRLLKAIEGVDSWQSGRRYLIAPAAMASCSLTVTNKLAGDFVQKAVEAAACPQPFGTIDLGAALITYVGDKHYFSLGKWSSCRLALRQNYLLEYDMSSPIAGLPRGFAHLEHATAYPSHDFPDSFELHFYASPCAKKDPHILMIRVNKREERDCWVACLNKAARWQIDDLWEFEAEEEVGRGRYASVLPAKRKGDSYQEYNCALKIVDKNEFWRRVVKGRERADTLVRELSVQATLTAKCGRIPTFLQLRGFFETSDNVVLELELLEGIDLFDYVFNKGILKEADAALITQDILRSLEAMNRVGLAHRDIKPANIIMCNPEKDRVSVKVGDFGMSTFVGVDGLIRGRCGTPGYVAPEILTANSGVGYGNKVDIFSAGVTLYVMLCGKEPYYGVSEKALIDANKKALVDFPEGDWQGVSEEARDLIRQMLKAQPSDRISAKNALQHPWIIKYGSALSIESSATSNGKGMANKNGFHLAASDAPAASTCIVS